MPLEKTDYLVEVHTLQVFHDKQRDKQGPDRLFHSFRTSSSRDRRTQCNFVRQILKLQSCERVGWGGAERLSIVGVYAFILKYKKKEGRGVETAKS